MEVFDFIKKELPDVLLAKLDFGKLHSGIVRT